MDAGLPRTRQQESSEACWHIRLQEGHGPADEAAS